MKTPKKLHQKLLRIALSTATLVSTTLAPVVSGLTPAAEAATVNAKRADAFVDSMCVNTHLPYLDTVYGNYAGVKQKLLELGIRHIRDGGTTTDVITKMKDLAAAGIKTTFILDPRSGVAPNSSYWVNSPAYNIKDFVKNKVGTNVIDAVEVPNEMDLNYSNYYWRPGDPQKLNDNPNSPLYWVKYMESITKDTWNALKSDAATAGVKVIGPSLGRYVVVGQNPLPNLSAYVDWGNSHPYPFGGNPNGGYFNYATIGNGMYYAHSNFPGNNVDEYPYLFQAFSSPFGSKPMTATETGYYTGKDTKAVSENVHGKYMPRLFLEYFRKGIVRTCSYELLDEGKDPNWSEANFGLLRNDFSPKPAYTALKNMIGLLKDPAASFTPGSLDYTITVNPPQGYNRTQYVHSLLLQKQNGKFYLALWHEIANNDTSTSPLRELTPPNMPTTISFKTPIAAANVFSLETDGRMSSSPFSITNNTISINAKDRVRIIELTPQK